MHGPDAAMQMRLEGFKGPIIGVTGDQDTQDYLDAGADIVLVKPVTAKKVLDAIAKATEQRASAAAAAVAAAAAAAEARRARSRPLVQASLSGLPALRTASAAGGRESANRGSGVVSASASVRRMPSVTQSVKRAAREAAVFVTAGGDGGGVSGSGEERDGGIGRGRIRMPSVRGLTRVGPNPGTGTSPGTGTVRHARAALSAKFSSRSARKEASVFVQIAPSAPSARSAQSFIAGDSAIMLDEALTVRWEDLVTYTLEFKLPEHRTNEVITNVCPLRDTPLVSFS